MIPIPDISLYTSHRVIEDIDLEGAIVPGLTGHFYQREEDGRIATIGHYSFRGEELFLAWGYRDEPHCAWTAYRSLRGEWTVPHEGCPRTRTMPAAVVLQTGEREIVLRTQRVPAGRTRQTAKPASSTAHTTPDPGRRLATGSGGRR